MKIVINHRQVMLVVEDAVQIQMLLSIHHNYRKISMILS